MRAVDAGVRTGIDVQLAVDDQPGAEMRRHRRRQRRVVVDLEPVARGVVDLEALMAARLGGLGDDAGVELDLGAALAADDVLVQALVVGLIPATAGSQRQREHKGDRQSDELHSERASSRWIAPSYSERPRMTAVASASRTA